jgi:hypothetical protein
MTYLKIFIYCLMLCALGIAGCTSNTSTSSGFATGSGYNINLTITSTLLPRSGQTTLIATVRDAQGNPVNDDSRGVSFTSTQGATITLVDDKINLGVCTAVYTAPADPGALIVVDQITASYQGAYAYNSIEVYKP